MQHIEIDISSSLSASEWNAMKSFCDKVQRLTLTKLVASNVNINGHVQFTQENGLQFTANLPPEEQIAEFLMAFRFFYLENEPTNFYKILNIMGKHTLEKDAKKALKLIKLQWDNALFQNAMSITINEKQITAPTLLDLWFNAHYFHSDESKNEALDILNQAFTVDYSKFMLLDSVFNSTKIILMLYDGLKDMVARKVAKNIR